MKKSITEISRIRVLFQLSILTLFLLQTSFAFAQPLCNDDIIMEIKGKWSKRPDAMDGSNQVQLISRMDKMQQLLQSAYPEPKGIEAGWYRSVGSSHSLITPKVNAFGLNALFKVYYCNSNVNKLLLGSETGTWFYIWVNQFSWFLEPVDYFTIKQQPVFLLTPRAGELNGYPVYKGLHNENSNTGIKYSRTIIITRNGASPYVPVEKRQYLEAFLQFNEKSLAVELLNTEKNTPAKTDEEEEANKKSQLEKIERTTAAGKVERAKNNFLKGYVTDKQRKEKWLADSKIRYETATKPVRELLANSSEAELKQPVILKGLDISKFTGFSTEEEGGQQLVALNPAYFDSKLPAYVPQFLIVYWRWDKSKPAENFKDQFEANFNFQKLKEMIDK